jgi:hypothetical protein
MALLERVQQLESDKESLEERCLALQEGLSQMVNQFFYMQLGFLIDNSAFFRRWHMLNLQLSRDL